MKSLLYAFVGAMCMMLSFTSCGSTGKNNAAVDSDSVQVDSIDSVNVDSDSIDTAYLGDYTDAQGHGVVVL